VRSVGGAGVFLHAAELAAGAFNPLDLREKSFDLVARGLRLLDNLHPHLSANAEELIEAKVNTTDEEEQCNIENKA